MFCPRCRAEYREGFLQCADCRVALDCELPPLERPVNVTTSELVTVLQTGDSFILGAAKSLLESAGITYLAKGEALQDLFAAGRLGFGFSPIAGPVDLQVILEDEEQARNLLAQLDEQGHGPQLVEEEPQ